MQGSKREQTSKQLYVGWTEGEVIAINPDLEELEKIGIDVEEEPQYVDEEDGIDRVRIDVWLKEVKTGYKYKKAFWIKNDNAVSKAKEGHEDGFVAKTQYINQIGDSTWAENKKGLKDNFTKFRKPIKGDKENLEVYGEKVFRIAKKGEADLMGFLRMWLNYNYRDVNTNILLDLKKLFNGNFKELKEQVGGEFAVIDRNGREYPSTVVSILEVKSVDGEDGHKEFQGVFRESVPGWQMKSVRNTKFTKENVARWVKEAKGQNNPEGVRWLKDYEKVAIKISTGEYKSKNFYSLDLFHEYNPEENFVAGEGSVTKPKAVTETEDDY